jgi:hypothetical protein
MGFLHVSPSISLSVSFSLSSLSLSLSPHSLSLSLSRSLSLSFSLCPLDPVCASFSRSHTVTALCYVYFFFSDDSGLNLEEQRRIFDFVCLGIHVARLFIELAGLWLSHQQLFCYATKFVWRVHVDCAAFILVLLSWSQPAHQHFWAWQVQAMTDSYLSPTP